MTYFLNGGHEEAFKDEDRTLMPSPRVATYDLEPEMSAAGVADETIKGIEQGYPFIALNLLFSLQAAYAAPLILLAQTRQADRDKAHADRIDKNNTRIEKAAKAETDKLLELLQSNTSLTQQDKELTEQVAELTTQIHALLTQKQG